MPVVGVRACVPRGVAGGIPRIRLKKLDVEKIEQDRQKALEAGCDDFDTKPVELARLLVKIEELLKKFPPKA